MSRKYSLDLLEKIQEKQETINVQGAEVIVKNIPDCDEKGAMDPRLYKDMKVQMNIMRFMPKNMMKMDVSEKSVKNMRKQFNGIKSVPIVTKDINITNETVKAEDGYNIPIRIYNSISKRENAPILYFIHGGGFMAGSPDVVEELVKLIVEKTDILAFSIDYRLAPEHPFPTGHTDCYTTLKWIYENAEAFGGDKNNIFVAGDSAGGNLAQYCTTRDMEDGRNFVKGQLLLYPTLNMCDYEDEFYSWSIDKYEIAPKYKKGLEKMLNMMHAMVGGMAEILGTEDIHSKYLSPYVDVSSDYPSTFITVGEHDFLMIECLAYAAKLKKQGVDTETILYRGLGHAYGDNVGVYPQSEDLAIEMGSFILKNSKKDSYFEQ